MKKSVKILLIVLTIIILIVASFFVYRSCTTPKPTYNNIAYGTDTSQKLDIFLPSSIKGTDSSVPAILLIHGGSWTGGDKKDFYYFANSVTTMGYAAITINYRCMSEKNNINCFDMLDDINSALIYLKKNGNLYNIDTSAICMFGASAGAHLAMLYSYKFSSFSPIKIALVVSRVGPSDLSDTNFYIGTESLDQESRYTLASRLCNYTITEEMTENMKEKLLAVSPINYITNSSAPTIMCYGKKDLLVPYSNAEILEQKLIDNNVTHAFVTYENSGHDLENDADSDTKSFNYFYNALQTYLPIT